MVKITVYKDKLKKKKLLSLRDSLNILPSSLRKLAKEMDVLLKQDVDRTRIEDLTDEELESYVIGDCVTLAQVLNKSKKLFGITKFKDTIAGQSFTEWKSLEDEKLYRTPDKYFDFIQSSYYGGRTEVFKRYGKNLKYCDINSMYPDAMKNNPYPAGNCHISYDWHDDLLGIYEVEVESPKYMKYPFLPVKKDNKLLFPLGKWTGTYTSAEIKKALDLGYNFKIIKGLVWNKTAQPFNSYIDKWHKIKTQASKDGNGGLKLIAKLYLNSLYGKFGQRREFRKIKQGITAYDLRKNPEPFLDDDLNLFLIDDKARTKYCYNQLATFVTSYARIKLYEGFEQVMANGGEVYYCDTDSLVTDVEIKFGSDLGEWELEHDNIHEAYFLFPKVYSIIVDSDDITKAHIYKKSKGFDSSVLTFRDYKKALYGNYDNFKSEKEVLAGIFESNRRHIGLLDTIIRQRQTKGTFDKRILDEDMINTEPLKI